MADKLFIQSRNLSTNVTLFCRELKKRHVEGPIVHQLLRSGTSVFANVRESHGAQGRNDFAAKLHIALKECNECDGWLVLLRDTNSITNDEFLYLHNQCVNVGRILSCSIRTAKANGECFKKVSRSQY